MAEARIAEDAISLGYPDEGAPRRRAGQARKPLSEIVHEERYGQLTNSPGPSAPCPRQSGPRRPSCGALPET